MQRSTLQLTAPADAACWARWLARIESEHESIAHLLHGELGGLLTVAGMHLQRRATASVRTALQQALQRAAAINRDAASRLYPQLLRHLGLAVTLQVALQQRCDQAGLRLELLLPDAPAPLTSVAQLALYRCAMQAIDNVVAHAAAGSVQVQVLWDAQRCLVQISDEGRGCDPAAVAAKGGSLCALATWLGGLDGGLSVESAPECGCILRAWLPAQPIAATDCGSHS
jgi:signal transduction histidine kinase